MSSHAANASFTKLTSNHWEPESHSGAINILGRAALLAIGIVLAATIAELVHLREDRSFWLSGDSPARLRSFVCEMFYPLVCLQIALLFRMTWTLFVASLPSSRFWLTEAAIILVLWGTLGFSLLFAVENNLCNVLADAPCTGIQKRLHPAENTPSAAKSGARPWSGGTSAQQTAAKIPASAAACCRMTD